MKVRPMPVMWVQSVPVTTIPWYEISCVRYENTTTRYETPYAGYEMPSDAYEHEKCMKFAVHKQRYEKTLQGTKTK
jgi:hypothetical protein